MPAKQSASQPHRQNTQNQAESGRISDEMGRVWCGVGDGVIGGMGRFPAIWREREDWARGQKDEISPDRANLITLTNIVMLSMYC